MITIYSKAGCPQCDSAKTLLKEWEIDYKEVRIDIDNEAREFVLGEGHRSVPQLYVGRYLLIENGLSGLRTLSAKTVNAKVGIYEDRKR